MKGNIFNIQKFSIHDGPGVRTTVFLKGCPLKCAWCANPESQSSDIQILYDEKKCVQCQTCVHICPQHAISFDKNCNTIYSFGRKKFDSILNAGFSIENKRGKFYRKFKETLCRIYEYSC